MFVKAQSFTNTSYLNTFTGSSHNLNGQNWTQAGVWGDNLISYTQNGRMSIGFKQNQWIFAENKFDQTVDISSNKILEVNASFSTEGKFLLIQLMDVANRSSGIFLQSVFPLTQDDLNYEIDFNALPTYNIDFSKISAIRFWIVNDENASNYATLNNETLIINSISLGVENSGDINDINLRRWSGDQQNINIYNTNSAHVSIGTNANEEPLLSTPYYKFTVKGRTNIIGSSNAFSIWHPITNSNGFRPYIVLGHENFSNGESYGVIGVNEYNSSTYSARPKHLLLQTNPVDGGANVGIGGFSTEPIAKLTIAPGSKTKAIAVTNSNNELVFQVLSNGNIWATKVNVALTTDFPDYVFQSSYNLMSLDCLEAFIDSASHLPKIPKSDIMEKEGIDLAELSRLQMEKIEELTLYIIELNKKIAKLEEEMGK